MRHAIRLLSGILLSCVAASAIAGILPSPFTLDFPATSAYTSSEPKTIALQNDGDAMATITHLTEVGVSGFPLSGGSCGPVPFTIAAHSECTLEYTFSPTTGGSHSAIVQYGGPQGGSSFSLSGHGLLADLEPPATLEFHAEVGTTSPGQSAELRNVGDGILQITEIPSASGVFARSGGTCGAPPFTLHPNERCTLTYTFTPVEPGDVEQSLFVRSPVGGEFVRLIGHGAQGSQSIDFPAQSPRTYSPGATFPVDPPAIATSGLPVVYGSNIPAVCTVSGSTVAVVAAGTCSLTANQPGNASWSAAAQQVQAFGIARASQSLSFPSQFTSIREFVAGGSFAIAPLAISAAPNGGQPILYSSLSGGVCGVSGTTVTMLAPGTCTLAANQAGNANYSAASQATAQVQLGSELFADGFEAL